MADLRPEQDELQLLDEPELEPAHVTWQRRLEARRPQCLDTGQLTHHAASILGRDLDLDQVAFWQQEHDDYVVIGGFGLNPAARRRRVPAIDPALEALAPGGWQRWDATRFDPPRSTWLPGNTAPDLCVLAIEDEGPIDLVTLAGAVVTDQAVHAVREFVAAVNWTV